MKTVLIERDLAPKDQASKIKEAAGGELKLVLECTGVESSISTAIFVRLSPFSHVRSSDQRRF